MKETPLTFEPLNLSVVSPGVFGLDMMKEMLERGGTFTFTALGGSMRPLIPPGSALTVEKFVSPPRPGDIAFYRCGGEVRAHRLISVSSDGGGAIFIFKGDALGWAEEILPEQIIGRITTCRTAGAIIRMNSGVDSSKIRLVLLISTIFSAARDIFRALKPAFPKFIIKLTPHAATAFEQAVRKLIIRVS